ncbi:ATP-binding protein [Flindersiella endophytica]
MRRSLPWRLLACVLAVLPLAVCATALLGGSANQATASAQEIRSELLAYANEHRSWDGVEPLLRELADRAGVPIALSTPDGEAIAASSEAGIGADTGTATDAGRIDAARVQPGDFRPPAPNVVAASAGVSLTYYQWQLTDAERQRRQALAEQAIDCLRDHAPANPDDRERVNRRAMLPIATGGAAEPERRLPGEEVCVPAELEQPTAAARGLAAETVEQATACLDVRGLAYEVVAGAHGIPVLRPEAATAAGAEWQDCLDAAQAAAKSAYVAGPADLYLGLADGGWERTSAIVAAALLAAIALTVLAVRRGGRPILMGEVAHELRAPLANVRSQLEAAQDGVLPVDRKLIQTLIGESTLLERLVADLQDLALADAGRLRIHPEDCDAVDLAAQAVAAHQVRARAGGVTLTVVGSGEPVPVYADPARIRQALSNLVSNALRYTAQGGRVEVAVGRESGSVVLAVADNGSGIEAGHLARVFERFYRVGGEGSGGAGLGLAIARQLVEAHGGRIEVASTPGEGSTFAVVLPGGGAG